MKHNYLVVGAGLFGTAFAKYRALAEKEPKTIFGGRLGEYRYCDMDAVLLRALTLVKAEIEGERQ
ncbi:MAG: hypothetical protein PUD80_05350 [Firmicutes bacterium]|nr:hypothetical protein [Bacillota bacterium]